MPHMMDDFPLLLSTLYERAVWLHPDQEIVSVNPKRELERTTYGETDRRVRQLATALDSLGVERGQAIGTFAWNNRRHHELYWATANTGRICHTLNIRLYPEQLTYIVNHGEDQVVFVDPDLLPLLEPVAHTFESVKHYVVLGPDTAGTSLPNAIAYEDLIADAEPWGEWPLLDERSPMMYCYTSGTTGNPKGVAYTQRSTYMHTVLNLANFSLEPSDNVMPVVPMFHAAAWGYPFMAVTKGAKITYPGPDLSPEGMVRLIQGERVTFSAGVPTVWLGIQQYLMDHPETDLSSIRTFLCGGSSVPRAMIKWFEENLGITILQGWGMTETNPVASVASLTPEMEDWDLERKLDVLESQGRILIGLEAKIVGEDGERMLHDGVAFGELLVRGPTVAAEYYNDERSSESFVDGWLRTGDVCKIDTSGNIRITDRSKDVIKSGGEWISSIDLENALMAHPAVAEAAVVGIKDEKWQERPLGAVVLRQGATATKEELIAFLDGKVAKWWIPEEIVFIDAVPKTGTGKFDKKVLRQQFADSVFGD